MPHHPELSAATVLAERLRRQRLTAPLASSSGYSELFRALQPVSPIASSRPGDPPRLVHRTAFDDARVADRLRARRGIVKGRFQGGTVGYVLAADLPLYMHTFRRVLERPSPIQQLVLEVVQQLGPLTPRQIKAETGLLNKQIMPALHRLQEAFLVYEDQTDGDWERAWYDMAAEWPDVVEDSSVDAPAEVLLRFVHSHVFATFEQIADWTQLPRKPLREQVDALERAGRLVPLSLSGLGEGWISAVEGALEASQPPRCAFMLHKADPLVRSHAAELKRRFGELETLQYLLIDGVFSGAVCGHWRIGPHDVEDIVVELPQSEREERRAELVAAVGAQYNTSASRVLRYAGQELPALRSRSPRRTT